MWYLTVHKGSKHCCNQFCTRNKNIAHTKNIMIVFGRYCTCTSFWLIAWNPKLPKSPRLTHQNNQKAHFCNVSSSKIENHIFVILVLQTLRKKLKIFMLKTNHTLWQYFVSQKQRCSDKTFVFQIKNYPYTKAMFCKPMTALFYKDIPFKLKHHQFGMVSYTGPRNNTLLKPILYKA